jgi:hypothetical protein
LEVSKRAQKADKKRVGNSAERGQEEEWIGALTISSHHNIPLESWFVHTEYSRDNKNKILEAVPLVPFAVCR